MEKSYKDRSQLANPSSTIEQLRAEMMELRRLREKDAHELSVLRKENAELRSDNRSWQPTQGTPIIGFSQDQGKSSRWYKEPKLSNQPTVVATITLDQQRRQGRTPFGPEIINAHLPDNWRSLALDQYDGTTDLDEHLDAFITTQVGLYNEEDTIWGKVFPTSLKGPTLRATPMGVACPMKQLKPRFLAIGGL